MKYAPAVIALLIGAAGATGQVSTEEAQRRLQARRAAHTAALATQPVTTGPEVERLRQRIADLETENADLRKKLVAALAPHADVPVPPPATSRAPSTNDIQGFRVFAERFAPNLQAAWEELEKKEDQIRQKENPDMVYALKFKLSSVDIVKTDSLVHPQVAVAEVYWYLDSESRKGAYLSGTTYRLHLLFAWDAGKWLFVSGTRTLESSMQHPEAPNPSEKIGETISWDGGNALNIAVVRSN